MSQNKNELVSARLACLALLSFIEGRAPAAILTGEHREMFAALVNQFCRLDNKERRQIEAGKKGAAHGKKGGRPGRNLNKKKRPQP